MEFKCERCELSYDVPEGWDAEMSWESDLLLKAPATVIITDPDTDETRVIHQCGPDEGATPAGAPQQQFYFIGSESPQRSVGRHLVPDINMPGEQAIALCGATVTTMEIDWLPRNDDCAYCLRKLPQ